MTKLSFEDWKNSNEMTATWVPDEVLEADAKKHNKTVEEIKNMFLQPVYQEYLEND